MNTARAETSVAVDVGGTFTDLVVYDGAGQVIRTSKVLTTPQDISAGIFESLREAGVELPTTAYLKHGTTTAINTVIERTGGKTALITTRGFEDTLLVTRGAYGRWSGLAEEALKHPRREEQRIVLDELLADVEREVILRALARTQQNKAKAAKLLGISRPRLLRRIEQLGLAVVKRGDGS